MFKVYNKCSLLRKNNCHVPVVSCYNKLFKSTLSNSAGLDAGYVPSKVETNNNTTKYFEPPLKSSECFTLILPPPNITGTLHLGHALTATIQDVMVRWNRMRGIETAWIPGLDHAGIATQVVVEKKLWKEKKLTRHDVGREEFEKLVWKWKIENENVIKKQLKRLNVSLDWDKETFTMDEPRSEAVTEAFIRLFDAGLIYRADHLVNWSCVLQSAISDIEVEHLNIAGPTDVSVPGYEKPVKFGQLTSFSYKFEDSDVEEIVVSSTRLETMLGDSAVAVNPRDERYLRHVGRKLRHPFLNKTIPVIADDFVDVNFGTGAVKVTPAHDRTDFEAGKRHDLETISVIDESGKLTDACGEFAGLGRFEAREILRERLSSMGLLKGTQDHQMIVPICSRSKDVVELLVRPQWFVRCDGMAANAVRDVKEGRLTIDPPHFDKTWFNWLENIRDWCVSRQLWWGHRIPAYECSAGNDVVWVAAKSVEEARKKALEKLNLNEIGKINVRQDEDVLDTWFSSSLLPFSAFGWPKQTALLSKHYPLSVMETGHDILFFWVARMAMLGAQLNGGQLPFDKVLLHGIVCDSHGAKMSKSLGNVISPDDVINGASLKDLEAGSRAAHSSGILSEEELDRSVRGHKKMFPEGIPQCGADSLRFTLSSHNIKNHFINFDVSECYTNKLFGNKIWQATKFTKLWFDNVSNERQLNKRPPNLDDLHPMDKWILSKLDGMVSVANEGFENNNFHVVTHALKNFLYFEFCDVYLESTKRGLRELNSLRAASHVWTLLTSLDVGLRVLAPFMPTLAAHLHSYLPLTERNLYFPQDLNWKNEQLEKEISDVMSVVIAIRRLKKMFNVVGKHKPEAFIISNDPVFSNLSETIEDLASCHKINIHGSSSELNLKNTVVDNVGNTVLHLIVPQELIQALEMDSAKMEKKKEKLLKELEKMNKMVSGSTYNVNVAPEVQESHSNKIAGLQEKLSRINYIETLTK